MKNRRIDGALSLTVNLGHYESAKVHVGLSCDIEDRAIITKKYIALFEEINEQLQIEVKQFTEQGGK